MTTTTGTVAVAVVLVVVYGSDNGMGLSCCDAWYEMLELLGITGSTAGSHIEEECTR